MRYSKMNGRVYKYGNTRFADQLYNEARYVASMFISTGMCFVLSEKYTILQNFIEMREWDCESDGMRKVVQDLVGVFGYTSGFWVEWRRTRELRKKYRQRILYFLRVARKHKGLKPSRKREKTQEGYIRGLSLIAHDLVNTLQYKLLTEKQHELLLHAEHALDIYWEDLSQAENGLTPRKGAQKWMNGKS